jgi:Haem-binding domain
MKKALKWAALLILVLFVGAQAYRLDRTNPKVDESKTLGANARVTPEAAAILERSCKDCHSSETRWPWYSHITPVSWFLKGHVEEGRRALNLSEWGTYAPRKRERKLHEICEQVESGEMPIQSYLPLHPSAKLSDEDRRVLCEWARGEEERVASEQERQSGER